MTLSSALEPFAGFAGMFGDPANRWFALYLATSVIAAFGVYEFQARRDPDLKREGFFGFLFPRELWTHSSTRLDLVFFVFNKIAFGALLAGSSVLAFVVERATGTVIGHAVAAPLFDAPPVVGLAVTTIVMILAFDFGLWFAHYLGHRVPILWEFHKVHHSVEVLTPLAAGRVHPVDDILALIFSALGSGLAFTLCVVLFGQKALVISAFQAHIVVLAFYILGFHLRHSHVWLPYTGWLGHILVSPAHHQVHHSAEERHWDRNMGFIFAIWDWMFGTLWVPAREKEEFRLGLGGEEREFSSMARLYLLPFVKSGARIRAWARRRAVPAAADRADAPDGAEAGNGSARVA
jgi:sterol desaturase/sphingolipid hydroxylase (fatty acid hydroxylase superfamily)